MFSVWRPQPQQNSGLKVVSTAFQKRISFLVLIAEIVITAKLAFEGREIGKAKHKEIA